jgi:hypothetical protein
MRRGRDGEGGVVLEIRVLHRHGKSIREIADSDDVARSFRDHVARCSDMMSPA